MTDRRQFVTGIATVGTVGIAGCADTQEETKSEGETDSEVKLDSNIEYTTPSFIYSSTGRDTVLTSIHFVVGATNSLSLAGETDPIIQVNNLDTGQNLFVIPEGEQISDVSSINFRRLYESGGQLIQEADRGLIVETEDGSRQTIPVSVEGNEETIRGVNVFSIYQIALVDNTTNPKALASTREQIYGIGHERKSIEQEGTTGEINLSLEFMKPLDSSWYIEFTTFDPDDGFVVETKEIINSGTNKLEWSTNVAESEPGTYEGWAINIYPEQDAHSDEKILTLRGDAGFDDDQIVIEE